MGRECEGREDSFHDQFDTFGLARINPIICASSVNGGQRFVFALFFFLTRMYTEVGGAVVALRSTVHPRAGH